MSNLLNIQPRESLQMGRMLVSNPVRERGNSAYQAGSTLLLRSGQGAATVSSLQALSFIYETYRCPKHCQLWGKYLPKRNHSLWYHICGINMSSTVCKPTCKTHLKGEPQTHWNMRCIILKPELTYLGKKWRLRTKYWRKELGVGEISAGDSEAPSIPWDPSAQSEAGGQSTQDLPLVPFFFSAIPQGDTGDGIQTNSDNHFFLISPGKGKSFFLKKFCFYVESVNQECLLTLSSTPWEPQHGRRTPKPIFLSESRENGKSQAYFRHWVSRNGFIFLGNSDKMFLSAISFIISWNPSSSHMKWNIYHIDEEIARSYDFRIRIETQAAQSRSRVPTPSLPGSLCLLWYICPESIHLA